MLDFLSGLFPARFMLQSNRSPRLHIIALSCKFKVGSLPSTPL
jgi:hypothetical protein